MQAPEIEYKKQKPVTGQMVTGFFIFPAVSISCAHSAIRAEQLRLFRIA
jgi:hypothetical protein